MDNPRTRRLARGERRHRRAGARARAGSLRAAATEAASARSSCARSAVPGGESADVAQLVSAVRAILNAIGVFRSTALAKGDKRESDARREARATEGPARGRRAAITASASGARRRSAPRRWVGRAARAAGALVRRGEVLARVVPPLGGRPIDLKARRDGLVLESPLAATARAAQLFLLGDLARADVERAGGAAPAREEVATAARPTTPRCAPAGSSTSRCRTSASRASRRRSTLARARRRCTWRA